jgi:hypothetical protein
MCSIKWFMIVVLCASVVEAAGPINAPQGTNMVRQNAWGGYTFYGNKGYMGRAIPNNVGNYNYYNQSGRMYSRGRATVGGQYRFYNNYR